MATKNSSNNKVQDEAYSSTWDGSTDTTTKNAIYDAALDTSNTIKAFQALGSTIKAINVSNSHGALPPNAQGLADGRAQFEAVYIPRAMTITGVKWYQSTQGSYTADNNNYVALYSYSGGTLTQVAISANDGNIWKAAQGIASAAFTSPYNASPGIYYIAALYNNSSQSVAPVLLVGNLLSASTVSALDFTNSAKLDGNISGQTSLSSSIAASSITGSALEYWFALY